MLLALQAPFDSPETLHAAAEFGARCRQSPNLKPGNGSAACAPGSEPARARAHVDERHPAVCRRTVIRLQDKQCRSPRAGGNPGECAPTILQGGLGDAVVEPNQMHFQKRKILDRVRTCFRTHRSDRTIPKRGFVLELGAPGGDAGRARLPRPPLNRRKRR